MGSAARPKWTHKFLHRFEWVIPIIALVLSGIGLTLIYSATSPLGESGSTFLLKQLTWLSLGGVLTALVLLVDYSILERWAPWIFVAIVVALIAVWAVGKVTAGSRRWIDLGLMRFQPSEFAKLAVVIILAKYFQHRTARGEPQPLELLKPIGLLMIPTTLVLIQPDLGTAIVIFLVGSSMIVFAGMGKKAMIWAAGILIVMIPLMIVTGDKILLEYQKRRLTTFMNPDSDPLGAGYHIIQSQIAIGSGGIFGKGFLKGTQNQLMFLPVKHTDFIFSILAEEWGFIGCSVVLLLFAVLLLRGMSISGRAKDDFGTLLSFGCTIFLFWHVVINIGMVMGLMPVVGVPLIFLSYGGSSLLASFLAVSIIMNVGMRRYQY